MTDTAELSAPESSAPSERRLPRLVKTQRVLQVILGLFWILDAALQFQPYMFGKGFVNNFILANASGQPAPIAWFITNVGHFISPDVAVWNTFFALIQLAIGVGLLYRPTVRSALAVSFVWALGVWVLGEGLGMIFTGTATALTGAPGSVLMYGLLGLMAWPRRPKVPAAAAAGGSPAASADDLAIDRADEPELVGVASSAAGHGIGGAITPLAVWSGFWLLSAVLFLLPANRTQSSISSAITGMAPGSPSGYAHFLNHVGSSLASSGTVTAWILAIVSVVIGLGPLAVRRPSPFLFAGGLLAGVLWITGQGWLGGVFSGSGTDPNTGPLVVVLALAMVPATLAEATTRTPLAALLRRRPALTFGSAAFVGAALILSATYPVSAQESSSSAMSGMSMSGSSSSSSGSSSTTSAATSSGTASNCTPDQKGIPMSGLDLNNTPAMAMGGPNTVMDMNGSDASAAAGLNTTKVNWHYTGPPLPSATSQLLLADGANGPKDIHMAVTGCAKAATATQLLGSTQYVQSTSQAAAAYATPAEAMAAGYVAVSPTTYPIVTYVNPTIVAANAAAKRTLDPKFIDGLVYATLPSGQSALVAAMYILPSTVTTPPMPYGALVQWHQRTQVCGTQTGAAATSYEVTGSPPCAAGTVQKSTPYVTLVWQVPVAGGPLAIQPPDIQIVEAAVMASA
jgi:hypothetical protein